MKRTFVTSLSHLNSDDLSSLEKMEKSDKIIVFCNKNDSGINVKQFSALSATKAKIEFTEFAETENSNMQTVFYLGTLIGSNTKEFIILVGMGDGISDVLSGFSIQAKYAEDFGAAVKFEQAPRKKRKYTKVKDVPASNHATEEQKITEENSEYTEEEPQDEAATEFSEELESESVSTEPADEYISKEEYEQLKDEFYILSGCKAEDFGLPKEVFVERLITDLVATQRGNSSEYYVNIVKDFPSCASAVNSKTISNLVVLQDMADKLQKNKNRVV